MADLKRIRFPRSQYDSGAAQRKEQSRREQVATRARNAVAAVDGWVGDESGRVATYLLPFGEPDDDELHEDTESGSARLKALVRELPPGAHRLALNAGGRYPVRLWVRVRVENLEATMREAATDELVRVLTDACAVALEASKRVE